MQQKRKNDLTVVGVIFPYLYILHAFAYRAMSSIYVERFTYYAHNPPHPKNKQPFFCLDFTGVNL